MLSVVQPVGNLPESCGLLRTEENQKETKINVIKYRVFAGGGLGVSSDNEPNPKLPQATDRFPSFRRRAVHMIIASSGISRFTPPPPSSGPSFYSSTPLESVGNRSARARASYIESAGALARGTERAAPPMGTCRRAAPSWRSPFKSISYRSCVVGPFPHRLSASAPPCQRPRTLFRRASLADAPRASDQPTPDSTT